MTAHFDYRAMHLEINCNYIFSKSYFPWYGFLPKNLKIKSVSGFVIQIKIYKSLSLSVFTVTPSVLIPLHHSQVLCSFALPVGLYRRYTPCVLLANPSGAELSGNSVCMLWGYLNFFSVGTSTSTSCSCFSYDPFFLLCSTYTSF